MSPAEARIVRQEDHPPVEGAVAQALNRCRCPGIGTIEDTDAVSHVIYPGDTLIYCAGDWRCERCAQRIARRDP